MPIFRCQTPLKNARFELFGILKCQLATVTLNPNFGETVFGETGRHRVAQWLNSAGTAFHHLKLSFHHLVMTFCHHFGEIIIIVATRG